VFGSTGVYTCAVKIHSANMHRISLMSVDVVTHYFALIGT
jgi:hypothetical protein